VISRVSATMMDPDALEMLQQRAHETMNGLAGEVCEEAGLSPAEVYEIVVCGNVTMMQLALGIDPEPLGMSPFIITARRLPPAVASDFGVRVHPRAPAAVFPALGAYVGGDIVAGMLATGLTRDRRIRLFIDVGTNSEIALGSSERVVATAAPAGPANAIYRSQREVRELQFAKASIATGWRILIKELGIGQDEITQVLLAGSFGSYLSPASAVRIGLVPKLALPRIISAGNVAGEGAKMAALSLRERAAADAILDEVEYVELSGRADFNDMFMDELAFPG
jgi:uncharacterized 2Fe-2S/4Fe-4S cluster protein (DUF4445 family)